MPTTLTFTAIGPICVGELPYIHWELTTTGPPSGSNLATITVTDINGNVLQTLTDQPLVGSILWPGASANPVDWPGWVKIAGVWYSDSSDSVLRQGVYIQADLGVSAGPVLVAYPVATEACAQPAEVAPEATTGVLDDSGVLPDAVPGALPSALPVTGTSSPGMLWIAGGFLGLGAVALGLARRRRPA